MGKKKDKHRSPDRSDGRRKTSTNSDNDDCDHNKDASTSSAASKKRYERVEESDLPEPWQAFHSSKRDQLFYFNPTTKETTWEKPKGSVRSSGHTSGHSSTHGERTPPRRQKDKPHRQAIAETSDVQSRKRRSEEQSVGWPQVQPSTDLQIEAETSMDVDPVAPPATKRPNFVFRLPSDGDGVVEEPMDIDMTEEVNDLRNRHQFVPFNNDIEIVESESWPVFHDTPQSFIVFDTSALLGDFNVLKLAMSLGSVACIIPYVAIQELDALKTSSREKLSRRAIAINDYILNELKRESQFLFVEPAWESAQPLDLFDCRKNDDYILKCAIMFAQRLEDAAGSVYLATNDKNLSIKALANGIAAYTDPEVIEWLKSGASTSALSERAEQMRSAARMREEASHSSSLIFPSIAPSHDAFNNSLQREPPKQQGDEQNKGVDAALRLLESALSAVLKDELRVELLGRDLQRDLEASINLIFSFPSELVARNVFPESLLNAASLEKLDRLKCERSNEGREELLSLLANLLAPLKTAGKSYSSLVRRACSKADEVTGESRVLTAISWRDQSETAKRLTTCLEETLKAIEEKCLIGSSRSQEAESSRRCKLSRDADRLEKSLERLLNADVATLDDVSVFVDVLITLHRYYCDAHQVRSAETALDKKTAHQLLRDSNSLLRNALCELRDEARSLCERLAAS
uniref:WW domain-containing protein n=1 Tax=Plectus sambesii TaxID=2011161 RepID=A0A914XC41_9BILA